MALPGCTICFEDFDESNQVSALDCGHIYHFSCIRNWLRECSSRRKTAGCPSCKKRINWFPAKGTAFKVFFHFSESDEMKKAEKEVADLKFELARQESLLMEEKSQASSQIAGLESQLASTEDQFLMGNDCFGDSDGVFFLSLWFIPRY